MSSHWGKTDEDKSVRRTRVKPPAPQPIGMTWGCRLTNVRHAVFGETSLICLQNLVLQNRLGYVNLRIVEPDISQLTNRHDTA